MRILTVATILLILSMTLININIYTLLHNISLLVLFFITVILITFTLTYLSTSIIISLIISLIPLIVRINLSTSSLFSGFYLGYDKIFEFLKNSIMLVSVLFALFFKLIIEKKIPKDSLLYMPSIIKSILNGRIRGKNHSSIIILSNSLITFGIFLYVMYIITTFAYNFLEYYIGGTIVSITFFTVSLFIRITPIERVLIMISSWFSPILFMASLLDHYYMILIDEQISDKGIYLGEIKAKLDYARTTLNTYEITEPDQNISIKDKWVWVKKSGKYYYDPLLQENPHILILGSSGTGKSTLAATLSCGIRKYLQSSITIIDFHGEYYKLVKTIDPSLNVKLIDSSQNKISLFDIIREGNIKEKSLEISTIIQKIFNLGQLQRIFLQRIIEEAYAIIEEQNVSERKAFLEAYNIVLDNAQTDQELRSIRSLEPYIRTLALEFFGSENISIDNLFNDITIIDLSTLYSEQFKNLYAELILLKIYDNLHVLSNNAEKIKYILVDEAHRLANSEENALAKIVVESRKYNIGVIVSTQHPRSISEDIIGNTALQIVLQLKEPTNLEYAAKLLAGYHSDNRLDTIKKAIYYLPRFHGLVKDSLIREPLLIDFTRKLGDRNG